MITCVETTLKEPMSRTNNGFEITNQTLLMDIIKRYPYIKEVIIALSPKFKKLKNPFVFKTISSIATIEMISRKGDLTSEEVIYSIIKAIDERA